MAVTERDITGWFAVLHQKAETLAGADLPKAEREQVKQLANAALMIGQSIVVDLNRIAWSLELLAEARNNG